LQYAFITVWSFRAPIDAVWEVLSSAEEWPSWWRGVESVEAIDPGGTDGVGSVRRFTWKSRLPYRLVLEMRNTHVERPHRLEGRATGELEGVGRWDLRQEGEWTTVRYEWRVRTTKAWMNLLAPLAKPFFVWNHDVVMAWGGEGLARHLGCERRLVNRE
jgi:carbon monoxide dehydrogenase subunit G